MIDALNVLQDRCQKTLPGAESHRRFAPEMAYGRHRGPIPANAHRAAVVIALVDGQDSWRFPLILRSDVAGEHRGQISLPGGRLETNELSWYGAKREFTEELGVAQDTLRLLTPLTPLYVYASNHSVQPFVAHWQQPRSFAPNPAEVAELLWVSVADLVDPANVHLAKMLRGNCVYNATGFRLGEHFIWGATAMILAELAAMFV